VIEHLGDPAGVLVLGETGPGRAGLTHMGYVSLIVGVPYSAYGNE